MKNIQISILVFVFSYACTSFSNKTDENKGDKLINVSIKLIYKESKPKLELVFDNNSNEDYTIGNDLYSCIEIANRKLNSETWIENPNWIESETAISNSDMNITNADGIPDSQNIASLSNYRLIIPAKKRIIKMISCNFIDVLKEDSREVRIRFIYDYSISHDTNELSKTHRENIKESLVSDYYYAK